MLCFGSYERCADRLPQRFYAPYGTFKCAEHKNGRNERFEIRIAGQGKTPPQEMIDLAEDSGIVLIISPYSMFKTSGLLYEAGIKGVF